MNIMLKTGWTEISQRMETFRSRSAKANNTIRRSSRSKDHEWFSIHERTYRWLSHRMKRDL